MIKNFTLLSLLSNIPPDIFHLSIINFQFFKWETNKKLKKRKKTIFC